MPQVVALLPQVVLHPALQRVQVLEPLVPQMG